MTRPLALVAGIPLALHQRTPQEPSCEGWDVRTIPSMKPRKCDFSGISTRVFNQADDAETSSHDGVHLIVAHEGHRDQLKEGLRLRCYRVAWLPEAVARQYGQPAFEKELCDLLAFEMSWRTTLRPSVDSPLLLPEEQFAAEGSTKDMWKRVFGVGQRKDGLGAVAKTVDRFRRRHRHKHGWRDTKALVFDRHGPPHGTHGLPTWRRRKFTFALPDGFHFDVTHEKERQFELTAADGMSQRYHSHANVDAYGYTRGGN